MDQIFDAGAAKRERLERIINALDDGLYIVDGKGEVLCTLRDVTASKPQQRGLIAAIEAVIADTSAMGRSVLEKFNLLRREEACAEPSGLDDLSEREREVLGLICRGHNDQEMSRTLGLSRNTIRNHVAALYRKIGVNRRGAAIIWARERGITADDALKPRARRRPRLALATQH